MQKVPAVWGFYTSPVFIVNTIKFMKNKKKKKKRRFLQQEALPLHFGWADGCDCPKCGQLGYAIYKCGGLRTR